MSLYRRSLPALLLFSLAFPALVWSQKSSSPRKSAPAPIESAASASASPSSAKSDTASSDRASKLPVRRVILYKSGVGYFEHLGRVSGDQSVHIDFSSGQLNDVLQSLTILDLNGGRIGGVTYNSEAPLGQRLGALRLPLEEQTSVSKFYEALRGARLEVRSSTSVVTGRLLSVERKTRVSGGTTLEVDLATLVSDSGEVRSIELTPAITVRLADSDVSGEVGRYLLLLSSERQADLRRMNISTEGSGDRQLYVSYISEVPVWKTTYRIVLPTKSSADTLLQGWAIVDNTVGEDWNDVELSLVAGAPQSFIQQLSQPYYATRPVIPLPANVQLTPQTHEGAMTGGLAGLSGRVTDASGAVIFNARVSLLNASGGVAASTTSDNQGHYEFGDIPAGQYTLEVQSPGFQKTQVQGLSLGGGQEVAQDANLQVGTATQTVTVTGSNGASVETESAEVAGVAGGVLGSGASLGSGGGIAVRDGSGGGSGGGVLSAGTISSTRGAMQAAASGADLGDLFEYKLKDRVTIHKNESALVPIVQAHIAAEKVSLWNDSLGSPRPLRALWLTNSSPLT
ncbi:MAG: carboxypeptidase-like regulatory domain-containing protein, partial [Candidatus Acidiferrales bacterium]